MMLRLRRPTHATLRDYASRQGATPFSYPEVGATTHDEGLPKGYTIDRYGVELGQGEPLFERARASLANWDQCRLGWVEVVPETSPAVLGTNLAVLVHVPPSYFVNGGRVTVLAEHDSERHRSFSIGYGTLIDHAEQGEEKFSVSWDKTTGLVRYDVVAFSKPRMAAARLLKFWTRRLQRRFARDSCLAMQKAVA